MTAIAVWELWGLLGSGSRVLILFPKDVKTYDPAARTSLVAFVQVAYA